MTTEFFSGKRVLVTGASGLVGSHFTEELLRRGARVRIVIHERPSPFPETKVEVVRGDLKRMETCLEAANGMDAVVHAAGVGGGSKKVSVAPIGMFTDSLLMNTQVLEAARLSGVERYLFISNSSVYASSDGPLAEPDAERGTPENETGMVKRAGETQCRLYAKFTPMRIAIVRGGNAYGPRDNFDLETSHVVPALIRKAVERLDPYEVWGSGEPRRDFIHAGDIARGGLFLLERHADARPVNIATGRSVTIRELVALILAAAGHKPAQVRFSSSSPPASPAKLIDVTRMTQIGFTPSLTLAEGLRETVEWYRSREKRLRV